MTPEAEALATAAYKGERVAARRLAARGGIPEAEALRQILTQVAGVAGLPHLLLERERLRRLDADRRAARTQEAAQRLALRQARTAPPTGGWRGWFDGSAHPNPGRIGIGALLCGPAGERLEISRRAGYGNSGEAEYLALTALLEMAVTSGATALVVAGDSQVVITDVNLSAQAVAAGAGAAGLQAYRSRVLELIAQVGTVTLKWLPRHRNGDADRLSQQATEQSPAGSEEEEAEE